MLKGISILGASRGSTAGAGFYGINPATDEKLQPEYFSASPEEVDSAAKLAEEAFVSYSQISSRERAAFSAQYCRCAASDH